MVPVGAAAASPATNYVARHHSAIFSGAASPSGAIATLRVHKSLPVALRLTCESKFPNLATLSISSISNGRHQQLPACSDDGHFHFSEKDVESDESLWNLYERWRAHFGVERSARQRSNRFPLFKKCVMFVHDYNNQKINKERGYSMEANRFADRTSEEVPRGLVDDRRFFFNRQK